MEKSLHQLLSEKLGMTSEELRARIVTFYQILKDENERQNLTRLISPESFFYGHFLDVQELVGLGWLTYPVLDLGSGGGIPGLIAALLEDRGEWILADSEIRKAEFLSRAVKTLGLQNKVQVYSGRAEEFLKERTVQAVVTRAVGPLDRIYSWIRKCSTWNTLVLLKGPAWEAEWQEFKNNKKWQKELHLKAKHTYTIDDGLEKKSRCIVLLSRT